jgi:hypothetical protein
MMEENGVGFYVEETLAKDEMVLRNMETLVK